MRLVVEASCVRQMERLVSHSFPHPEWGKDNEETASLGILHNESL